MLIKRLFTLLLSAWLAISLSGCDWLGNSSSGSSDVTLSGTAATGLPFSGTVQVINANGVISDMETIGANGSFSVTIKAGAPYLVRAQSGGGDTLFSYAAGAGTVNVTPLTNLAVFMANGKADISGAFVNGEAGWRNHTLSFEAVENARQIITENIKARLTSAGIDPYGFDLFYDSFNANQTGFDAVLDGLTVAINLEGGSFQLFDAGDMETPLAFNVAIDLSGFSSGGSGGSGSGGSSSCSATDPLWCLNISGTTKVVVMGAGTTVPFSVDTTGIAPTSEGDVSSAINSSYPGENGTITVTFLVNTATEVKFNVKFTGAYSGVTTEYDLTYDYVKPSAGGDSGSGGGSGGASLPDGVSGQIVTMEYCCAGSGSPYNNGDQVLFTFSSSGSLMLTDQYTVVADSFTVNASGEYVWSDTVNGYDYLLSVIDGAIHEVNVMSGSTFLGQFSPVSAGGGSGGGSGGSSASALTLYLGNCTLQANGNYLCEPRAVEAFGPTTVTDTASGNTCTVDYDGNGTMHFEGGGQTDTLTITQFAMGGALPGGPANVADVAGRISLHIGTSAQIDYVLRVNPDFSSVQCLDVSN